MCWPTKEPQSCRWLEEGVRNREKVTELSSSGAFLLPLSVQPCASQSAGPVGDEGLGPLSPDGPACPSLPLPHAAPPAACSLAPPPGPATHMDSVGGTAREVLHIGEEDDWMS